MPQLILPFSGNNLRQHSVIVPERNVESDMLFEDNNSNESEEVNDRLALSDNEELHQQHS